MDKHHLEDIYQHADYINWDVNTGDDTVHARRIPGRFRLRKWLTMIPTVGLFFILPYIQWSERQAVLFDIPERKFYLFGGIIWPQDLWMLALLMLFCFVCLFAMTAISGRIFCGFTCPQSVWTDILTSVENFIEGSPAKRIKLDAAPWGLKKIQKKLTKHAIWIIICAATAVTFVGYFSGIYQAWSSLFSLSFSIYEWVSFGVVFFLFYINTGFVREQVCNWICPYARIQGVMSDASTIVTTYDEKRGESRGRLVKGKVAEGNGDCIDCNICVSVCPTGVDIRKGQQLGCINCGLCIDGCDSVMDKLHKPRGLIRFMSHNESSTGIADKHPFLRTRPIVYSLTAIFALLAIIIGIVVKSPVAINVHHERSPLYTMMSDGSIQNLFHMDFMNKTEKNADFILITTGFNQLTTNVTDQVFHLKSGEIKKVDVLVKVHKKSVTQEQNSIFFELQSTTNPDTHALHESVFIGPRR